MRRLLTLLAVLALAAPPTAFAVLSATMKGTTGPGFTITLKKAGKAVKTLKAGRHTITVSDKSSDHNFVLKGPGVNKQITALGFTGTKTATVTLKKGRYTYFCTPHQGFMKGSFTVK